MAFGGFQNKNTRTPMAEMNMVPLIDVMLVLLVIFIVTAPLLSHSVKLELPQASSKSVEAAKEKIDLAIRSNGELFYNGNSVDRETAQALFAEAARKDPMPEVHIYADRHARLSICSRNTFRCQSGRTVNYRFYNQTTREISKFPPV